MNTCYKKRRNRIFSILENCSIVILFSGSPIRKSADKFYDFKVNSNFFYITGLERQNIIYMAIKSKNNIEEMIFIEKPDEVSEKWSGKLLREDEAYEISGVEKIYYLDEFENHFSKLVDRKKMNSLHVDLENWGFNNILSNAQNFVSKIKRLYPHLQIKDLYYEICEMRKIKDEIELEKLGKAIDVSNEAFLYMVENVEPGMKEYELEAYYEFKVKMKHTRPSLKTIVASSNNATILHYTSNTAEIRDGDLLLFDFGVEYKGYCSDITRTIPINGKYTERQKKIYNIVLEANREAIKMARPNITINDLNNITKSVLFDGCKKIGLVQDIDQLNRYYYHGVSHFLGIDVHDVGDREGVLKEGMVITVEPGLYIEEEEIGIRIEDDILITKEGSINLTEKIIKDIEDIEYYMNKYKL